MEKIDWVDSMKVLRVKNGDTIVVKPSHDLSEQERVTLASCIDDMHIFKDKNITVLILGYGYDIGVIRHIRDTTVDGKLVE